MDTRALYEEAMQNMYSLLEDTIQNMNNAYSTMNDDFQAGSLFSVTSPQLILLKSVSHFNDYQIRNELASLCQRICETVGFQSYNGTRSSGVDFYVCYDGQKTGYTISMNEVYMPEIDRAVAEGMDQHFTVVLKQNLLNCPPNNQTYRNYPYKSITSNISLRDFFEHIQPGEFDVFKKYIDQFNYEAELLLGFAITPKPTYKNLTQTWEKVKEKFESGFFNSSLIQKFEADEIDLLWNYFREKNILRLSQTSFADSFISSEWYYDLFDSTDGVLEQTAIIAGYLKSIEQLLFSLMLSRCDDLEFLLRKKRKSHKSENLNKDKFEKLTKDNQHQLLTMAGDLLTSIKINYKNKLEHIFVSESVGKKVIEYLEGFVQHTRNGYLHKDNIYTENEIKNIRTEAYCAYFLLGAAVNYQIDQIDTCA